MWLFGLKMYLTVILSYSVIMNAEDVQICLAHNQSNAL